RRFATALELATAVEEYAATAGEPLGARWIARALEAVVGPGSGPWLAAAPALDERSEGTGDEDPAGSAGAPRGSNERSEGTGGGAARPRSAGGGGGGPRGGTTAARSPPGARWRGELPAAPGAAARVAPGSGVPAALADADADADATADAAQTLALGAASDEAA